MRNIRYHVFFLLDRLRGGVVKNHIADIKRIRKSGDNSRELEKILSYARENIEFYKNIPDNKLASFPVMNKEKINKNRSLIENKAYDKANLHVTSTSGSTGVPFLTYLDMNKRKRTIGDLMTLFTDFDFYTGDRYVFIRSWVEHYDSSKKTQIKQNFIPVDVNTFNDEKKEELRNKLKKDKKIVALITYSSALEDFVGYLESKGDNASMFHLKVIFASSDRLSDETKMRAEKMFGATVVNRYSNEECGIMGNTPKNSKVFNLNISSYYFELLDLEKDVPVKPGEVGRLVVTDLFNRAMPLIRYDLGDLGVSDDCGVNVKTLNQLVGRIADSIKSDDGILITAATLSTYMQEYKYVEKYQLVCTEENELHLKVVTKRDELDEIEKMLKRVFGNKRKFLFERVSEIPNEKNGKFKQIINKFKG